VENRIGLKIGLGYFPLLAFKYHNKWKILADICFDIMENFPCILPVSRIFLQYFNLNRQINMGEFR